MLINRHSNPSMDRYCCLKNCTTASH